MYLVKTVKLKPNKEQEKKINILMEEYIKSVNYVLTFFIREGADAKITTDMIPLALPSSMKTASIKDAKKQYKLYRILSGEDFLRILQNPGEKIKERIPYVHNLYAKWNKNTVKFDEKTISLPSWDNDHYERMQIKYLMPEEILKFLDAYPPISVELIWRKKKLIALFTSSVKEPAIAKNTKENVMGIDLNIKCPAVCVTSDDKVLFAGNGKQNQYMRRHYKAVREKCINENRMSDFKAISGKEKNYMTDQDHKISRQVIDFAIKEHVTEIHMEKLSGARSKITAITKKQKEHVNKWSYYRLGQFIEYKAKMAGIKVVYVSPVFTSQICPKCQEKTKPIKGGMFICPVCGYTVHNDLLAAMNIRDRKEMKPNM